MLASLASARRRLALSRTREALSAAVEADPSTTALVERLHEWRRRLARASGVPPHVLLHDSTVRAIAVRRPTDTDELLGVPGIGPVKVARFGPAILEVIQSTPATVPAPALGA